MPSLQASPPPTTHADLPASAHAPPPSPLPQLPQFQLNSRSLEYRASSHAPLLASPSSPALPPSSTYHHSHLHLSPPQMLAAQQHFAGPAFFASMRQQQQQQQQPQSKQASHFDAIAASMWQTDEYDSFIKSLINAQDPGLFLGPGGDDVPESSIDLDAAAMSSISTSHASSYFSGTSDSGTSPSSFHDFVYGAHNFPTPSDSDLGSANYAGCRNGSISMPSGLSPSSIDANIDAESILNGHTSASAPMDGAIHIPYDILQTATGFAPAPPPSDNDAWDSGFLAPSTESAIAPSITIPATIPVPVPSASALGALAGSTPTAVLAKPKAEPKKRTAAEMGSGSAATAKKASKPAAKTATAPGGRAIKKLKGDPEKLKGDPEAATKVASAAPAPQASQPAARPISKLPHMEVGSNATALAAIERLKAKRLQEAEEATEARRIKDLRAQGSSPSSISSFSSSSPPSKSEHGEKPELTPQMRQQKKVAHNAIERRYRNNINDRIAALRNAVPALRELRPRKTPSGRKSRKAQQEEDLVDGVPAATKLNKATILGKATDYIKYLKGRELRLASEVAGLRELVRSLEGGEELLELWESEMDKVVAEQEAAAATAAAGEEEDLSLHLDGDDNDVDEDDEDGGDDDEMDGATASKRSPAESTSRRQPRSTRGSKLALAPSRYMLATFLGVSLFGGGAEYAIDSSASDTSVSISRPSPGRVVVGASHQLLKRSTAYLARSTPQETHHLDYVPAHTLLLEVVRSVSLAVCFLLLIWPMLVRFAPRWTTVRAQNRQRWSRRVADATSKRRKEMLSSLGKAHVAPCDVDLALRKFVQAPRSAIAATWGIAREASVLLFHTYVARRPSRSAVDTESLAVWARLLEVETSLEKLAQPSLVLRLHTALKVANFCSALVPARSLPSDAILSPARIHGTLAIAFAKLGDGIELAQDAADRQWELGKASIVKGDEPREDEEEEEEAASSEGSSSDSGESEPGEASVTSLDEDEHQPPAATATTSLGHDGWVGAVLGLELDEALRLLSSPHIVSASLRDPTTTGVEPKKYRLSPLIAIADSLYTRELGSAWTTLFSSLVKGTCPTCSDLVLSSHVDGEADAEAFDASPFSCLVSVREFCNYQASSHLDLDVVSDEASKGRMNARIAKLAATAPRGTSSWELSRITLATWALMLGNVGMAKAVASLLPAAGEAGETAASSALRRLLLDGDRDDKERTPAVPLPHHAIDALASSLLGWLHFLRQFSALGKTYRLILASNAADAAAFEVLETHRAALVTHTLELRRTLHAARLVAAEVKGGMTVTEQVQLEEDMDELVDILSAVGRRAANVRAKNVRTSKEMQSVVRELKWLDGSHPGNLAIKDEDSGVEF